MEFGVEGSGFKVQGSKFRVQGFGMGALGSGFRVQDQVFKVPCIDRHSRGILSQSVVFLSYRGTSLIRNTPLPELYSRTIPRVLRWSWGGGLFLMSEVLL